MLKDTNKKILYLSYDGVLEPLGSSQVLNYVLGLAKSYNFILYSFEKPYDLKDTKRVSAVSKIIKNSGIKWIKSIYHKSPTTLATLYDLFILLSNLILILSFNRIGIIHLRGYLLGIPLLILKKFFKFKLIFDMRGFWADEKADRAGWNRSGYKYIFFKAIEKKLLKSADKIITLTDHSREFLVKEHKVSQKVITTIRTCADENVFKKIKKDEDQTIRFGYLGTLDTAYNFQKVLNFFNLFSQKHKDAYLDIYSSTPESKIMSIARETGFKDLEKISVKFIRDKKELVSQINNFNVCIFYLNENFSVKASMPTKIGEVLMCGVPIICNRFNDDIEYLTKQGCGIITNFAKGDIEKVFEFVNPNNNKEKLNLKCIEIGKKEFSLKSGLKLYTSIYEELSK